MEENRCDFGQKGRNIKRAVWKNPKKKAGLFIVRPLKNSLFSKSMFPAYAADLAVSWSVLRMDRMALAHLL